MITRRKVWLFFVVSLVVLIAIGGGLWWFYQNTGSRLLEQAAAAIRANQIDDALTAAHKYIADNPDKWQGYYTQAQAFLASGRYDEARKAIERAAKASPKEVSVSLLLADTYRIPAQRASTSRDPNVLNRSVEQYAAAAEVLGKIQTPKESKMTEVRTQAGLVGVEASRVMRNLAARVEEAALAAEAKRDPATAQSLRDQAKQYRADAAEKLTKAKQLLLAAVVADPSAELPASTLVDLCLSQRDEKTLAVIKETLVKAKDQPPVATMKLVLRDLQTDSLDPNTDVRGPRPLDMDKAAAARDKLQNILAGHPDNDRVKLGLADLLIRMKNYDKAHQLCEEVLKANPRHLEARMMEANILIAQGKFDDAEKKLARLRGQAAKSPQVQFASARVALLQGKIEAARKALRAISELTVQNTSTRLKQVQLAVALGEASRARSICEDVLRTEPTNAYACLLYGRILEQAGEVARAKSVLSTLAAACPLWADAQLALAQVAIQTGDLPAAEAAVAKAEKLDPDNDQVTRLMADLRLCQGNPEQGLESARKYYDAHKDAPTAVQLFVGAAVRAGKPEAARTVLAEAESGQASSPEMLLTVSQGYLALNDAEAARKTALAAAEIAPKTSRDRLAVARACLMVDRSPQAEKLLIEELRRDSSNAAARFLLGRVNASTGRTLDAIDQFRSACELDESNPEYKLALAKTLMDSGEMGEAAKVLDSVPSSIPAANALRLELLLTQGRPVDMARVLENFKGNEASAIRMALPYLAKGQFAECVQFCRTQLEKTPDDINLHLLLARSLLGMGQPDDAVKQLNAVIRLAPDSLPTYLNMAGILTRQGTDDIEKALAATPGARKDLAAIATCQVLAEKGEFAKTSAILDRVVKDPDTAENIRSRAGVMLAHSLAATGKVDAALAELDRLAGTPAAARQADIARVQILISARREQDAEKVLDRLAAQSADNSDAVGLRRTIETFLRIKRPDKALATCDKLQALAPNDPRNIQLRAQVLLASDKPNDAADCYRKAIELQPQNFQLRAALAQVLSDQNQLDKALAVLREAASQGAAAAMSSLFSQGMLFARWGLQDQAVACFSKLGDTGYGGNPRVRLAMGQSLAALGQKDAAAQALKDIPQTAQEYVPAQLLLARLADTLDERLSIIQSLLKQKPGTQAILNEQMQALLKADRPADAVAAYRAFTQAHGPQSVSQDISFTALRAIIETRDTAGARELALGVANSAKLPAWRILAALLSADQPQTVAQLLPDSATADPMTVLTALSLDAGGADARAGWMDRLAAIEKQMGPAGPRQLAPDLLLVAVIDGDQQAATTALPNIQSIMNFGRGMAEEMATTAKTNPQAAQQARALLKASIALRLGVPQLANAWARQVLQASPTCQWAAALAFRSEVDPNARAAIPALLQPEDCTVRRLMTAEVCQQRGDYTKAGQIFAQAAQAENGDPTILLRQAICTEYADKLPAAAELYRKVWQEAQLPAAANNFAYSTIRLHPKDPAKLAEAKGVVENALQKVPNDPTFLDTLGWLTYLQGDYEQACEPLLKAVRANPAGAENHYHLAMTLSACGQNEMACWHHQAAIDIVNAMQKDTRPGAERPSPDFVQAAEMAGEALSVLRPKK